MWSLLDQCVFFYDQLNQYDWDVLHVYVSLSMQDSASFLLMGPVQVPNSHFISVIWLSCVRYSCEGVKIFKIVHCFGAVVGHYTFSFSGHCHSQPYLVSVLQSEVWDCSCSLFGSCTVARCWGSNSGWFWHDQAQRQHNIDQWILTCVWTCHGYKSELLTSYIFPSDWKINLSSPKFNCGGCSPPVTFTQSYIYWNSVHKCWCIS